MRVVHGLAVELSALLRGMLAARRETPAIAFAVIEAVIHVSVEMIPSVKPRSRADKDAAAVPFRSVISVGSALIRRLFIVAVRAFGLWANL